jgi:hypothetical protein
VKRHSVLLGAIVFVLATVAPAGADPPSTDGNMFLGEDTVLTQDHVGSIILSDGVTLDCDGHTVHGKTVEDPWVRHRH